MAARISFLWMLPFLLPFCWGATLVHSAPALRSLSNPHFEVVGLHWRSVTFVNELSTVTVEIAERYLDREGMAFPLPILVSLRPDAHARFEEAYRIRVGARGAVELDIRWEAPLTLETTCRALSEALLVQYAIFNYGSDALDALRDWPIDGLAQNVFLNLRPGYFVSKVRQAREANLPELSAILHPFRSAPTAESSAYGYWLLEAMHASGLHRADAGGLFRQAVAGFDIEAALSSVLQPVEPTAAILSLDTWWSGQMGSLLGRDYGVIETMEISRQWLGDLARFDAPLELESGEIALNLRSLRQHREHPQVREWVAARYNILRLRMTRINPAYYNAARSLGVLFEALLNDVPPHEFLHALTFYLSDWEDAKAMQTQVEKKL